MTQYKQWDEFVEEAFEIRFWKLVNNSAVQRMEVIC